MGMSPGRPRAEGGHWWRNHNKSWTAPCVGGMTGVHVQIAPRDSPRYCVRKPIVGHGVDRSREREVHVRICKRLVDPRVT